MRLYYWVTALAVLSTTTWAKNTTTKAKPKRQLESLRTPGSLQYSLVLPHSRVTQFRALTSSRRISNIAPRSGHLPPYAVQMEPVVQYSQKDPLYDPNLENIDDSLNKNEIYPQAKILNLHRRDQASEGTYEPGYGSLPTAPLYSNEPHHHHYYEEPEPIIEIIIKESNESLPAPPPQPIQKKTKEPVQVFYVKYSKDPHSHDKVVYEKPIPAITPPTNNEDDHDYHHDYVTVTPEPYYAPPTTTLRAIIKPESEVYHSDSSVKITFGNENHHHNQYSDRREGQGLEQQEEHEETAPRPSIAYAQQQPDQVPYERSVKPNAQYYETINGPDSIPQNIQNYRPVHPSQQHAQSRIQFQKPYLANEQQLPRQAPTNAPFRAQPQINRQNPFNSPQKAGPPPFGNVLPGPIQLNNNGPPLPGPIQLNNNGPPVPGAAGAVFTPQQRPQNPNFHSRPNVQPPFSVRPHFNGQTRPVFHSGPQRPFHQQPPNQAFFDEAKYLQENYHTITTDQLEPTKDQELPSRPNSNFNFVSKPNAQPQQQPGLFQDQFRQTQQIAPNQLLPQQRPPVQFTESSFNKPAFSGRPNFFPNLKPSPPHSEENRIPFQQHSPQFHQQHLPSQHQQFSFHQGPQQSPGQQPGSRPQIPPHHIQHEPQRFNGPPSLPQIIPQTQFLPQPSSPPQFNFLPQSPSPSSPPNIAHVSNERPINYQQFNNPSERPVQHHHSINPSERPVQIFNNPSERPLQQQFNNPSERPVQHQNGFQNQANLQHHQNVAPFVPNGGELIASIPKYEQHITVSGSTAQPDYSGLSQTGPSSPSPNQAHQDYEKQQLQIYEAEQEQLRKQLAQNVQKQQDEINRLQTQLYHQQQQQKQQEANIYEQQKQQANIYHQQQQKQQQEANIYEQQKQQANIYHQQQQKQQQAKLYEQNLQQYHSHYNQEQLQATSQRPQFIQERSKSSTQSQKYVTSTEATPRYQSTSRTIDIKPTTQKYVSSTINSIPSNTDNKKEKKKKKPTIELPDEVPDDLRQQLLSSGILDNADISVLDYDKVGETPLDQLPPDQLANFFSAGGAQQISASENRPIIVQPDGGNIQSRIDDDEDQDFAASENVASYAVAPSTDKQAVEMKVVQFDPTTLEGQNIAKDYVKDDATQLDTVSLNDRKYNRYLPLKVSGNQFPLPDVLKGRKVTSVVVLAPVETEVLNSQHSREERATSNLKGIKFVAGKSLEELLKKPSKENFKKWLNIEKSTAADLQSVVLLVTRTDNPDESREIFMYDIASGNVNKLDGELSNAFVEAAETNSISKDIEKLAIEGEGTPESFNKNEDEIAERSENVPLYLDLSGVSLDTESSNHVSITSGYSKTKLGRSLRVRKH